MAAKAEEYALKGLWGRSAKAHLQAAALYKDAMQEATDAEVLKTLELLHTNHRVDPSSSAHRHNITVIIVYLVDVVVSSSSSGSGGISITGGSVDYQLDSIAGSRRFDSGCISARKPVILRRTGSNSISDVNW
ncbi:hypothetical protein RI367_001274 [Sorochytrium milnesiophthora]